MTPRLVATILLAATLHCSAQPATTRLDESIYATPAMLVDVGGRRLNLLCTGRGGPTVVFEAALGEAGWDFAPVHSEVSKHTRSCIYDRAGLGFSDPSSRPGTSANAVQDLAALLANAAVPPPYVLVGASYGAMNVRLFATRQRALVAGIVLIDGHHEDELERIDRISGGRFRSMMRSVEADFRECSIAARTGISPDSAAYKKCVGSPPAFFGSALSAAHLAQMLSPTYWNAAASEMEQLNTVSAAQVRSERVSLGALPIVSLTRGRSPFQAPGKPQSAIGLAVERANEKMQDEVASLSSRGTNRVVRGAGHAIHLDDPKAVVDAILEAVALARK